jgi:hypothetical protein
MAVHGGYKSAKPARRFIPVVGMALRLATVLLIAPQGGLAETAPRRPGPTQGGICKEFRAPAGIDRYCVSSVLPQDPEVNRFDYGPKSLFDNDLNTAWVEGVDGQGIGEWIVIEFDRLRLVKEIQICNGYNKGRELYLKNSRVKELKLEFSEREKRTVTLKDTGASQSIALPRDQPVKAYWVKFTLESVYPGSKFQDTAISELHVVSEAIEP